MAMMTFWIVLAAIALLAALSGGFRRRIRWALGVTAVAVAAGFQWQAFTFAGARVADATGLTILGDVTPVALAGALLWLSVRRAGELPFTLIVGAGLLIAILVLAPGVLSLGYANDDHVAPGASSGPDVLLLVLDGYGRADWLEAEFGFDNGEFLRKLETLGFSIADGATANYATTYASLASMLNLNYVFDLGEFDESEWDLMRSALTGRSGMVPTFRQAGYEIAYLENAWGGSQCGPDIDRCDRNGLVERSIWNVSQLTILAPLLKQTRPDPFNSVSFAQLASLEDELTAQRTVPRPRLAVAHLLLPHAPFLLNEDCSREDADALRRWGSTPGEPLQQRRANYAAQAQCVNRMVVDMLATVLEARPDTIVMITADHGPASTLDFDLPLDQLSVPTILERMRIFSAYRLPRCSDRFRQDMTPVNGARAVTDCALGTQLGEVEDLNYWAISREDPIESVGEVLQTGSR
jgi:hypothetical protein